MSGAILLAGARPITVRTQDGVTLRGIAVPAARRAPLTAGTRALTFVLAHGFTHHTRRAPFLRLVGWLRRFGAVRALDFRGHGRSAGASSAGGDPELLDVDAAVAAARADGGAAAVVTVGLSMGGGAALRQAALGRHRPDAVVGVSAVSRWYLRDTRPMRRVQWLLETAVGRQVGARALRVRLDAHWTTPPSSPVQVISAIAPTPLLLVHGDRDPYFPTGYFQELVRAAGPAATAWLMPGMGHAEASLTGPLVAAIGRWASATING